MIGFCTAYVISRVSEFEWVFKIKKDVAVLSEHYRSSFCLVGSTNASFVTHHQGLDHGMNGINHPSVYNAMRIKILTAVLSGKIVEGSDNVEFDIQTFWLFNSFQFDALNINHSSYIEIYNLNLTYMFKYCLKVTFSCIHTHTLTMKLQISLTDGSAFLISHA